MKGSKDLVKVILQKKHILLFSRMKKKIRLSKHLRRKPISKGIRTPWHLTSPEAMKLLI